MDNHSHRVTHNQYYRSMGITIDYTALEQLPEDGNVAHPVSTTDACSKNTSDERDPLSTSDVLEPDHLSHSFVPVPLHR